jgi:glutamyl/glutaminyl-tRNA synthetase
LSVAVDNFIALLGWSPKSEQEIFSVAELVEKFDLDAVNRAPAKFDIDKCAWVNQQHLLAMSGEDFAQAAAPYVEAAGVPVDGDYPQIVVSIQEKVKLLSEVPAMISFFTDKDYPFDAEAITKVKNNAQAGELLAKLAEAFTGLTEWAEAKASIGTTAKENGAKPGQLMFPTRVALSGMTGGPDLGEILNILGQEESIRRVQRAVTELS